MFYKRSNHYMYGSICPSNHVRPLSVKMCCGRVLVHTADTATIYTRTCTHAANQGQMLI